MLLFFLSTSLFPYCELSLTPKFGNLIERSGFVLFQSGEVGERTKVGQLCMGEAGQRGAGQLPGLLCARA